MNEFGQKEKEKEVDIMRSRKNGRRVRWVRRMVIGGVVGAIVASFVTDWVVGWGMGSADAGVGDAVVTWIASWVVVFVVIGVLMPLVWDEVVVGGVMDVSGAMRDKDDDDGEDGPGGAAL